MIIDNLILNISIKGVYSVKNNIKFINGEWNAEDVFKIFLNTFHPFGDQDNGVVSSMYGISIF